MAAVVLLAKSPAESKPVRTRTTDLARWLGCSASHVRSSVLPGLKEAGIAAWDIVTDEAGQVTGLDIDLQPLREAREGRGDHPMALTRRDLATLLRLSEAVIGPGWAPKDAPVTPEGLLADRQEKGAATDRLALLLLVLQTRPDGRVLMVGGSVAAGRGRAAATLARLLGCSVSGGAKVLGRLKKRGLVEVAREKSSAACFGRSRLRVPAVAAAHNRTSDLDRGDARPEGGDTVADHQPAPCHCAEPATPVLCGDGWAQESFDDVMEGLPTGRPDAAPGDLDVPGSSEGLGIAGIDGLDAGGERGFAERPDAGGLHTTHPQLAKDSTDSAGEVVGCSGSAVSGLGQLPERAGVDEDQPAKSPVAEAMTLPRQGSPLRGAQQIAMPVEDFGRIPQQPVGRTRFAGTMQVPEDLVVALAPVAWLWSKLGRTSTSRWLAGVVRRELARVRGLVGEELAERVLAERLERRLLLQGTRPVTDLRGWLIRRGLPQRAGCWSHRCDDGVRMDTGGGCDSCDSLWGDRRALRWSVAVTVAGELPQLSVEDRRREVERRLHDQVQQQAAEDVARRERERVEQEARQQAVARQREKLAEEEWARAAAACVDCGIPEAAGRCPACLTRRHVEALVREAVDLAVAVRADLEQPAAVAQFTHKVEVDTWALISVQCARWEQSPAVVAAFAEREVAQRIVDGRRRSALQRLACSEAAEDEADRIYELAMLRRHRYPTPRLAVDAAERAAEKAREAAARELLQGLLGRLAEARGAGVEEPERADWRSRCAELARRPLVHEAVGAGAVVGAGEVDAA
ncbi:hypothetical protein ABR737_01160 [Streptomyces sp. Edi2]|uniref:hypothetical protein n=1 Tax=Streptomyces sp. Edi2 TaxID=3162528 RepID=UPI003305B303